VPYFLRSKGCGHRVLRGHGQQAWQKLVIRPDVSQDFGSQTKVRHVSLKVKVTRPFSYLAKLLVM